MPTINYITRPTKLPERLIYKTRQEYSILNEAFKDREIARIFEPRTSKVLGQVIFEPTDSFTYFGRSSTPVSSLGIVNLKAYVRNQNVGTDLLNFCKNQSYEKGCKGKMHLVSSDCYDEDFPPHTFYRKYGFDSFEKEKLNSIDSQIHTGYPEYFYFGDITMFYTPKN